jgi:hypothetical protein
MCACALKAEGRLSILMSLLFEHGDIPIKRSIKHGITLHKRCLLNL